MIAGMSKEQRDRLSLEAAENYHYLTQVRVTAGCQVIPSSNHTKFAVTGFKFLFWLWGYNSGEQPGGPEGAQVLVTLLSLGVVLVKCTNSR